MDEFEIDYRVFFRNVKFELYNIFKEINLKGYVHLDSKQFYFLTFTNDEKKIKEHGGDVVEIDFVRFMFSSDSYSIKYDEADLSSLAKYVGAAILDKCAEKEYDNIVIRDYSAFTSHNQVNDEGMHAPFAKYILLK